MKIFLLVSLLYSLNANAGFDFLSHNFFIEFINKQIAKQQIDVDLSILNLQIANGLNEAINTKIESEPSYVNGYYTRLDKINFSTNANLSNILNLKSLPFGFNMAHNAEVIFARQFKSQWGSVKAKPYNLFQNFPINAKKAKENLAAGDFVSFHAALSFIASKGFFGYYNLGLSASSSAYMILSGDFLINIFKISSNKIRVKFIASRANGTGIGANSGYNTPIKVVGFNVVDDRIHDWVNVNFNTGINNGSSDVFLMDFIFNLDDPKAAAAYTNLISNKAAFKEIDILNPIQTQGTLATKLLTDMSEVEQISQEDHELPAGQRRIDRVFKGANSAITKSTDLNFTSKIFNFSANKSFTRNQIENVDRSDKKNKYLFDVYTQSRKYDAIFNTFGDGEVVNYNVLLTAREDWSAHEFYAISLSKERREVNFSQKDLGKIKKEVSSILPKEQFEKIDWKNWKFHRGVLLNASYKYALFFYKDAINRMRTHDSKKLKLLLTQYLESGPRLTCAPQIRKGIGLGEEEGAVFTSNWIDDFEEDINVISNNLAITFNPDANLQDRYNSFLRVKDFQVFLKVGAGFLISLLPPDEAQNLISFELSLSAKGVEPVSYKLGTMSEQKLYQSLLYIQSIISNRSFDLRLYTDENGEFKPNYQN
jgi:hypothetical protein